MFALGLVLATAPFLPMSTIQSPQALSTTYGAQVDSKSIVARLRAYERQVCPLPEEPLEALLLDARSLQIAEDEHVKGLEKACENVRKSSTEAEKDATRSGALTNARAVAALVAERTGLPAPQDSAGVGGIRALVESRRRAREDGAAESFSSLVRDVLGTGAASELDGAWAQVRSADSTNDATALSAAYKALQRKAAERITAALEEQQKSELASAKSALGPLSPERSPAFNWRLLAGAELSQKDDEFKTVREYLRFTASDRLGSYENDARSTPWSWNRIYTGLEASLTSIPVKDTSPGAAADATTTERAGSVEFGFEWRALEWSSSDTGNRSSLGLIFHQGLSTFTGDAPDDLNSVNSSYGVGFRIGEHVAATQKDRNPLFFRYFDLTYGDYEQFDNGVWTASGLLKFSETDAVGLFVGFRSIFGGDNGRDDFAFVFGMDDALKFIAPIFENIGGIFGAK